MYNIQSTNLGWTGGDGDEFVSVHDLCWALPVLLFIRYSTTRPMHPSPQWSQRWPVKLCTETPC